MKKVCSKCNEEKDIGHFRKDRSRVDGLVSHCKECQRSYYKAAYTEKYVDKYKDRNKSRRDANAALLLEYKQQRSCERCGESEPVCLDFHHTDPTEKEFGIGTAMGRNWSSILEEIKKCIIVCSNCHRKIHAGLMAP